MNFCFPKCNLVNTDSINSIIHVEYRRNMFMSSCHVTRIIFLKYSGIRYSIFSSIHVDYWPNMLISSCHDYFRVGFVKSPGGFCQNSMWIFSKVQVNFSKIHVDFLKSTGGFFKIPCGFSKKSGWIFTNFYVGFV